jgi:hypothetical protein
VAQGVSRGFGTDYESQLALRPATQKHVSRGRANFREDSKKGIQRRGRWQAEFSLRRTQRPNGPANTATNKRSEKAAICEDGGIGFADHAFPAEPEQQHDAGETR